MLCVLRLQAECLHEHAGFRDIAVEIRHACKEVQDSVDELVKSKISDSVQQKNRRSPGFPQDHKPNL
jgi:hypothetical protein